MPKDQPTIQAGINAAQNGDTVLVAPGFYNENISFIGKVITVISSDGAAKTIIDGGAKAPTVSFTTNETRNSIISGFTIQNGGIRSGSVGAIGGGIVVVGKAPSILNNIITFNLCFAIDVVSGAALIQGNELSNTQPGCIPSGGNGLLLEGSIPNSGYSVVIGNVIQGNLHANENDGGGIEISGAEGSVIQGNIIRNNATTGEGGGIDSWRSASMFIAQNLIYGNTAGTVASGMSLHPLLDSSGPFISVILNNTIVGNTVTRWVGWASQVSIGSAAQYGFINNIVVGNSSAVAFTCGTYILNYPTLTPPAIDHNDIFNPPGVTYVGSCPDQTGSYGNISADPQFVNAAANDFHLQSGSPAIDAGSNSALQLAANAGVVLSKILMESTHPGHDRQWLPHRGHGRV